MLPPFAPRWAVLRCFSQSSLEISKARSIHFPGAGCLSNAPLYWLSPLLCFPFHRTPLLPLGLYPAWETLSPALLLEETSKIVCLNRTAAHLVFAQRYIPGPSLTELWELTGVKGSGWQRALGAAESSIVVDEPVLGSWLKILPGPVTDG